MKRVLFLTYDFPYPPSSGGKTRAYNLLKHGKKNTEIHLFSFIRTPVKPADLDNVKKLGISRITFLPRRKFNSINAALLLATKPNHSLVRSLYFENEVVEQIQSYIEQNNIDIVHAESLYTGIFLPHLKGKVVKVYGSENIEHRVYRDFVRQKLPKVLSFFSEYQLALLKKEETAVIKSADVNLAVSKSDCEFINRFKKNCAIIPNGVDTDTFDKNTTKQSEKNVLLFVGNFTYFPNRDAIDFFYDEVFKKLTDVQLHIIGKGSSALACAGDSNISTSEYVEDIVSEYKRAKIFVFPVRIGGGTNFKVLEAMAAGTPVIAFPRLIKNIEYIDENCYFAAENSEDFVKNITKILNGKSDSTKIAENAKKTVKKYYDWKSIGEKMNKTWNLL